MPVSDLVAGNNSIIATSDFWGNSSTFGASGTYEAKPKAGERG